MRFISGAELEGALSYPTAIAALEAAFTSEDPGLSPPRANQSVSGGELLLMPGAGSSGVGVKLVTIAPGNPERGLPLIHAVYVLFSAQTLAPVALMDGEALTARRTASVSALATRQLARQDARELLIYGAGTQAAAHIDAIAAVRPIERVTIAGRSQKNVEALIERTRARGIRAESAADDALARADSICTCTTSPAPLFDACEVAPGAHINAVGSYRADLSELSPELMRRALVIVETVAAALAEAGEVALAIKAGQFSEAEIGGELADVVKGTVRRQSPEQITLFKSVGIALEDLAVAGAAARALNV